MRFEVAGGDRSGRKESRFSGRGGEREEDDRHETHELSFARDGMAGSNVLVSETL